MFDSTQRSRSVGVGGVGAVVGGVAAGAMIATGIFAPLGFGLALVRFQLYPLTADPLIISGMVSLEVRPRSEELVIPALTMEKSAVSYTFMAVVPSTNSL